MAERARAIAADLGFERAPADSVSVWEVNEGLLQYLEETDPTRARWQILRSDWWPGVRFLYRQSSQEPVLEIADSGFWLIRRRRFAGHGRSIQMSARQRLAIPTRSRELGWGQNKNLSIADGCACEASASIINNSARPCGCREALSS